MLAAFDEAESDLRAGQYTDYSNDTLSHLPDELKHEARAPAIGVIPRTQPVLRNDGSWHEAAC